MSSQMSMRNLAVVATSAAALLTSAVSGNHVDVCEVGTKYSDTAYTNDMGFFEYINKRTYFYLYQIDVYTDETPLIQGLIGYYKSNGEDHTFEMGYKSKKAT